MPSSSPSRFVDLLLTAPLLLVLPWTIGQLLRDRWWMTGLCFYIPSPLLLGALLLAAGLAWRRRRRYLAAVSLAAALAPAIVVGAFENRWRMPESPGPGAQYSRAPANRPTTDGSLAADTLTLVHWNVFRGFLGWDRIKSELAEHPADIYVISELPEKIRSEHVAVLGEGFSMIRDYKLGIACKGFLDGRSKRPESHLGLIYAVCQVGDQAVSVLAVDLPAGLTTPRRPGLEAVAGWIEHYQPDLVAGDFNAPRRSSTLANLPTGYSHAYQRVGSGWSYTWPVPLPVWAIDHCLLSPRVQPLNYTLSSSVLSDHRIQTLEFSMPDR